MNRIFAAVRVLFCARIMVIQVKHCKKRKQDRITLYGTIDNKLYQVEIMRSLANSIDADLGDLNLTFTQKN